MKLDTGGQPFDLDLTLAAGQAFRWKNTESGWWTGVIHGQLIAIRQAFGEEGSVKFKCIPEREAEVASLLKRYFRLDDPVACIYKRISRDDRQMAQLVDKYYGLRLLRQEPWECLISYICSATNSVERITESVENLSVFSQRELRLEGWTRYDFPKYQELAEADLEELKGQIRGIPALGNRVISAAQKVLANRLDLDALRNSPSTYAAVRALESLEGVSQKISDCTALFSLDKLDAFPIDRHIRAGMQKMYFSGNQAVDDGEIRQKAIELFGPYAGYAGQFIFHETRQGANK